MINVLNNNSNGSAVTFGSEQGTEWLVWLTGVWYLTGASCILLQGLGWLTVSLKTVQVVIFYPVFILTLHK